MHWKQYDPPLSPQGNSFAVFVPPVSITVSLVQYHDESILYRRNFRQVTVPHWSLALCNLCQSCHMPAVQEERQRSRERAESEAECASSGHEDMPVERILEAELAVEPKTESYGDRNMENSVCCQSSIQLPFPDWGWRSERVI